VDSSNLYESLLGKLAPPQRTALGKEQREWLAERSKTCVIHKGWVNCLANYYQQRSAALKKRSAVAPTPNPGQTP